MNTFLATLPIFFIITTGYLLTRLHIAKNRWIQPLNNFVYYIALPALTILSLIKLDLTAPALQLALVIAVATSVVAVLIFAGFARALPFPRKTQITIFLTATLGNTVFLGIPLANALTPSVASEITATLSVVFFTTALVMSLVIIEIWLKKTTTQSHLFRSLATNPIILSLVIGLMCSVAPIPQPALTFFETPLQLLAQTASPLALFALGGFLAGHHFSRSQWPAITIASAIKLLVLPALFWLVILGVNLPKDFMQLSLLLAATPTAVTAFVLTEKYKLSSELAAGVMLATTALAILTIPLLISFL